ncbi:MAG: hypothetical protein EOO43_19505 [Flavobacterium sp.]|nr:MAG: hypothetical protein EOO43_19505 [Flavobacterium sp.]
MLEKSLSSHLVHDKEPDSKEATNLNQLINSFLFYYTQETRHGRDYNIAAVLGKERYIVMQPKVEVCFADDINHSTNDGNNYEVDDDSIFPHQKSVYSTFLSKGYHHFKTLISCRSYDYQLDSTDKELYIPIRVDTNFVRGVKNFLENSLGMDHHERKVFLHNTFRLNLTGKVEMSGSDRNDITFFSYNFYMDRIIFNTKMDQAEIQFSYHDTTLEADFYKKDNRWILKIVRQVTVT